MFPYLLKQIQVGSSHWNKKTLSYYIEIILLCMTNTTMEGIQRKKKKFLYIQCPFEWKKQYLLPSSILFFLHAHNDPIFIKVLTPPQSR